MTPTSPQHHAGQTADTAALRERARRAIAEQPAKTVTVLSCLLAAHHKLGWLPAEALDEVAQRMDTSASAVWSIASFYPNFRFTPPNRHVVEVCWGPTCHVMGAQPLLQGLLTHLGLEGEGDTDDGAISLKYNPCLGVCPHGPAMSFDHQLAGRVSLTEAERRIALLRVADEEAAKEARLGEESEREAAERRERSSPAVADRNAARARAQREDAVASAIADLYAPRESEVTMPVERVLGESAPVSEAPKPAPREESAEERAARVASIEAAIAGLSVKPAAAAPANDAVAEPEAKPAAKPKAKPAKAKAAPKKRAANKPAKKPAKKKNTKGDGGKA
jgi:formate dehydrogenase subunit gamma